MAFTTIPAAGAKLRASVLSSLVTEVRPISAFKTSDTPRTSTAAKTADPDLTIALPANSSWDFELGLYILTAANAAGDFSGELAYPADGVISYGSLGLVDTLASGISADLTARASNRDSATPSTAFDIGGSTTLTHAYVTGRVEIVTAGSLTLNWAQLASNGNATTLRSGSRLLAKRVS